MKNNSFELPPNKQAKISIYFENNGMAINLDLLPSGNYQNIEQRIAHRITYRNLDQTPIFISKNTTNEVKSFDILCCHKNYESGVDPAKQPWIDNFNYERKIPPVQDNYVDMLISGQGYRKVGMARSWPLMKVHVQVIVSD